jgi:argininosuccinate synthase
VRDFVFPMFRANTVYEGEYLLGTSIARPLIAKRLIEIATKPAPTRSHGATGKGNDQVRFELGAYALMPDVKVIAPWREWDLLSREKLLAYAEKHGIPVDYEAPPGRLAVLDGRQPAAHLLRRPASRRPVQCRGRGGHVALDRVAGKGARQGRIRRTDLRPRRHRRDQRQACARTVLAKLNRARRQARHRPARPGGKPLRRHEVARLLRDPRRHHHAEAHRAIESITLDREVAHLKDDLMPRYASLIYNGYWWSPERWRCRR